MYVLPEDDANRQLANGFLLDPLVMTRNIQVLEEAGGWNQVLERFKTDYVSTMDRYERRFMVLLIDFDGKEDRLITARAAIPEHLQDRVFVIGAWSDPEGLRSQFGSPYETIGLALARDCRENSNETWGHQLLRHNSTEVQRLRDQVLQILFASPN